LKRLKRLKRLKKVERLERLERLGCPRVTQLFCEKVGKDGKD
jgi:hypothetical protein